MHFQKPILGTQLDWSNPLNKDLAIHLAMNEGHGDKVQDLSMKRNHGTLNGFAFPPTVASGWNPGQTGVGLNYDGNSDYIDCGNDASLNPSDAITVSVCIKTSETAYQRIISNIDIVNKRGYDLFMRDDGTVTFQLGKTSEYIDAITNETSNDGVFHNVVAKWCGGNIEVYIDGIEATYVTQKSTASYTLSSLDIMIGKFAGGALFKGIIDHVRIHNRALSAKEVLEYYINPYSVYLDEDD